MKKKILLTTLMGLLLGLPFLPSVYAQPAEIKGAINWVGGYVSANGHGASKKLNHMRQMKELARRAAVSDAQRNILELVRGIRVTSQTTVEHFIATKDTIKAHVEGFIKDAKVVNETFQQQPDGSLAADVEVRVCLSHCPGGKSSLVQALNLDKMEDPALPPQLAPLPATPQEPYVPKEGLKMLYGCDITKPVTGVIFNLEGQQFVRIMLPVVITTGQDNTTFTVYSAKSVKPQMLRTSGVVRYADSVEMARQYPNLGSNIMIISATEVNKDNMIIITSDSAKALRDLNALGNGFLADAKVVIAAQ